MGKIEKKYWNLFNYLQISKNFQTTIPDSYESKPLDPIGLKQFTIKKIREIPIKIDANMTEILQYKHKYV